MKENKEYQFVSYLEKLRDTKNRTALAKLRRGLGKKMGTPEMYPYVVPFLSAEATRIEHEQYFLIASLFALHPMESPRRISIGSAFRRIWLGSESIEKRFINLLSADPADISEHLRHAVSLARSHKTPIDYHQLLYDLKYWSHPDRFVQLNWARDFWGTLQSDNDNLHKGENS